MVQRLETSSALRVVKRIPEPFSCSSPDLLEAAEAAV